MVPSASQEEGHTAPKEEDPLPSEENASDEGTAPSSSEGDDPASPEEAASVIRVRSHKLDALLKLVGELTVVKTRIKRRLFEVEDLLVAWEQGGGDPGSQAERPVMTDVVLNEERADEASFGQRLQQLRQGVFEDEASLALVTEALEEGIRNLRLLPLSVLFGQFSRMVRDLARQQGKEVALILEGGETTADKRILDEMKSPLMHLIRNAMDHGLETAQTRLETGKSSTGHITLRASQTTTHVVLEVRDDGRGLDLEAIRRQAHKRGVMSAEMLAKLSPEQLYALTFQSGFSTSTMVTDVSGRGVGLDAVHAHVERLKGRIQLTSEPGHGCCFTIHLPVTLATTPVFIVSANGQPFAIPLDLVHSVRRISPKEIFSIEGSETFLLHDMPVSVVRLAHVLELPPAPHPPSPWPCIFFNMGAHMEAHETRSSWLGVLVDTLEDELEVVLKPHTGLLRRVRHVAGTTILGSGEVCMVLNPQDLLLSVRKRDTMASTMVDAGAPRDARIRGDRGESERTKTVLLAEDSITTRTQEKRILQNAGYHVIAAVDGVDALNKLSLQPVDALVSDIQMPNLDGLALAQRVRQDPRYKELPIILVTSLSSEEDLRRGLEVGANAYITKPTFEQKDFLETLRRLV